MEKKLAEYRAKQEKQQKIDQYQKNVKNWFSFLKPKKKQIENECLKEGRKDENFSPENLPRLPFIKKRKTMNVLEETQDLIPADDIISLDSDSVNDDDIMCCSWLQCIYYLLYFILWATIFMIFIKLEFGTVYLISSALILMYVNTRTGPRRPGEVSAYSVFNRDCVSIDGTLKAEQFEREIMFGAGSVR